MAYQALYRKYRPRYFRDVVGQDHITTILKNQIQSGRVSHAYLFCGSRGTGKTSTAKIFARAVNCLAPQAGEACAACAGCAAMETESVDIIEIDAASNNGVDDVRALIDQARFTPLQLKYKVYIIDEVHMLTGAASNALLKTLEEPPAHVLFLLATTEPQKLLETVISRCQRFDFKRLSVKDIVDTLKDVLNKAGAQIDEEGLLTIARTADGGMRDALSLADQCVAFCGGKVTAADVYDVLGSMDPDFLFRMADALIGSDAAGALGMLDEIVSGGRDLLVFTQDIMQHIRALLFAKECGECRALLDCTAEIMARYQEQAARASGERLLRALELITKTQNDMRWLGRPRVLVESALVRICRPEDEQDVTALMDRISRLEAALAAAEKTGMTPGAPSYAAQAAASPPSADAATRADFPAPVIAPPRVDAPPHADAPPRVDLPPIEAAPPMGNPPPDGPPPLMDNPPPDDNPPWATDMTPASPAPPPAGREPAPKARESKKASVEANTNDAGHIWDALRGSLKNINPSLYVVSSGVQETRIEGDTYVIVFPQSKESAYNMFAMPRISVQIQAALSDINDRLKLVIRKNSPEIADAQTKELREVFGDKLKILD